jgi:hypothetical protein
MRKPVKINERNKEVVTFFYMVFGHRIHLGMKQDEARKEAYDAVSLRYGISRGTLINIISAVRNSRKVNESAFRQNILSLMSDLEAVNAEMAAITDRNNALMSLLKECLEDDAR